MTRCDLGLNLKHSMAWIPGPALDLKVGKMSYRLFSLDPVDQTFLEMSKI